MVCLLQAPTRVSEINDTAHTAASRTLLSDDIQRGMHNVVIQHMVRPVQSLEKQRAILYNERGAQQATAVSAGQASREPIARH